MTMILDHVLHEERTSNRDLPARCEPNEVLRPRDEQI